MDNESPDGLRPEVAQRVADASARIRAAIASADDADAFLAALPALVRDAGLHLLTLPAAQGGLGATLRESLLVLAAVGAADGSTALGLAMHTHLLGGAAEGGGWASAPLERLVAAVRDEGAFVNAASSEEGTGSPARGGLPDTSARLEGETFRVTGEKTFTTWLPALRFALVSARLDDTDSPLVGNLLVDLDLSGVERLDGFDALGMRASASGRLRLTDVRVPADMLVVQRRAGEPDRRGVSPQGWFAACMAAVYLGIGEGARAEVVRWAVSRRPGDGSTAVADLPSVQLRLGRLDAALRAARILLLDVAARWDAAGAERRPALMSDVHLAKVRAVNAAVDATDEALRIAGGPGFLNGPLERAFRDARAGLINPPLDDVAYQGFAQRLVERERAGR
jgi:alkylation response protein AidB-like acyl-CoA dehydrogenase